MFKKALFGVVSLFVLLFLLVAGLLQWGPVGSPKVMLNSLLGSGLVEPDDDILEARLSVPEGFSLQVFQSNLADARFMAFSRAGDLLVAQPRPGQVSLVAGPEQAPRSAPRVLLTDLKAPHSVAFYQDWLYVAESNAIGRVLFDHQTGELRGDYQRIIQALPDRGNHSSKTIAFGPDGYLYLNVGSTCNVCLEDDERRATLMRFKPDGSEGEIYATGLRNTVGFDWAPWDQQLYATDNGRDLLGDDYPPCELNRIERGGFYGWPFINGFGDLDPKLGEGKDELLKTAISPVHGFRAHNAPLGMRFISIQQWPQEYWQSALVALHGSWNRSVPDGYKVVSLHRQADGSFIERDFLVGFERNRDVVGRPVDVVPGPDSCVYVSDDYAGVIYRVCFGQQNQARQLQHSHALSAETGGVAPVRSSADEIAKGQTLVTDGDCLQCHLIGAETAAGKVPLHDLQAKYDEAGLLSYFKLPKAPMPALTHTVAEQRAIARYLLTL